MAAVPAGRAGPRFAEEERVRVVVEAEADYIAQQPRQSGPEAGHRRVVGGADRSRVGGTGFGFVAADWRLGHRDCFWLGGIS